jgi:hypothetical protein
MTLRPSATPVGSTGGNARTTPIASDNISRCTPFWYGSRDKTVQSPTSLTCGWKKNGELHLLARGNNVHAPSLLIPLPLTSIESETHGFVLTTVNNIKDLFGVQFGYVVLLSLLRH